MTIDTHVHFWNYDKLRDNWTTDDMQLLRQHYLPQTISATLKQNAVDAVVAVQVDQTETETLYLEGLTQSHSFIKGVVGWVDLQNDNIAERLSYFSGFPIIKGWRHIAQSEPDDFLLGENFHRGIAALQAFNYTYDILIYHHQLQAALQLIQKFPNQKFVIDHCAKPDIKNKKINEWKTLMKEIALHPNVYCKLSGLLTETNWKNWNPEDFYPYLDVVFNAFGTKRLMFGSDWPVILLSGEYLQWKTLLEKYMKNISAKEQENIMGNNAINFYNL